MSDPDVRGTVERSLTDRLAATEDAATLAMIREAAAHAEHYVPPAPPRPNPMPATADGWIDVHVEVPGATSAVSVKTGEQESFAVDGPNGTAKTATGYALWLPHSCDEWIIGDGDLAAVLRAIGTLRGQLDAAEAAILKAANHG